MRRNSEHQRGISQKETIKIRKELRTETVKELKKESLLRKVVDIFI